MTRTDPFLVAVVLMAGLTAACGQNAATAEAPAERATETQAEDSPAASGDTATARTTPTPVDTPMAATTTPAPSAQEKTGATAVDTLPLRLGHYVRAGTPCNQASSADRMALVTRTGMSLNCTFKRIEKTGAVTYRVTSECSDGGGAWGREESVETLTDTYEIPNDTSFTVKYEGGSENSARYCAQVSAGEM